jgi:DNA-binding Xre family transcriptional regulator
MSGIDLAARIGRSQNYVAMQFRGEAAFSLRGLEEICAALALNPATVICDAQARTSGEAAAT